MLIDGVELKAGRGGPLQDCFAAWRRWDGPVYLAEDTKLHRKVSLKFLSTTFTQDRERLRRFEQEARAASALNHPNIITIYEIGEADGHRFIATEFIEGQTLRERLRSGLDIDEALEIAIQVASALVAAHRVNIVHRDIKPENIMIRNEDGLGEGARLRSGEDRGPELEQRSSRFGDRDGDNGEHRARRSDGHRRLHVAGTSAR